MHEFRHRPLTVEQQARLEAAAHSQLERFVVYGLLDTGLRLAELCALQNADYDFRSLLFVRNTAGRPRAVHVTQRFHALLLWLFSRGVTRSRVVAAGRIRDTRLHPRTVQRLCRQVATRAGLEVKVSPHVLRNTYAVRAMENRVPLKELQLQLGHARLETTRKYIQLQRLAGGDPQQNGVQP